MLMFNRMLVLRAAVVLAACAAVAEEENVGGGALEKDRKVASVTTVRSVVARGTRGGREIVFRMKTPEPAARLVLAADRATLVADGADATVVNVQAVDAAGDEAADSCELVTFACEGPGRIIGVGNGDPLSHEDDVCAEGAWKRLLFNGKCQIVLKAGRGTGNLKVSARLGTTGAVTEKVISVRGRE